MTEQEQQLIQAILRIDHASAPEVAMALVKGIEQTVDNRLRKMAEYVKQLSSHHPEVQEITDNLNRYLAYTINGTTDNEYGNHPIDFTARVLALLYFHPDNEQEFINVETIGGFSISRSDEEIVAYFIEPFREQIIDGIHDFYFTWDFATFPEQLKTDFDISLAAVVMEHGYFLEMSPHLQHDIEFIKKSLLHGSIDICLWLPQELLCSKEFFLEVIDIDVDILSHAKFDYKNDGDFILKAAKKNPRAIEFASDELKADKQFFLDSMQIYPALLKFEKLLNNESSEDLYTVLKEPFPFCLELEFLDELLHSNHRYSSKITERIFKGLNFVDFDKKNDTVLNRIYNRDVSFTKASYDLMDHLRNKKLEDQLHLLSIFRAMKFLDNPKNGSLSAAQKQEFFNPDFNFIRNWLFRQHLKLNYIDKFLPLTYDDKTHFVLKKYIPLFLGKEMGIEEYKNRHRDKAVIRKYLSNELVHTETAMLSPAYLEKKASEHRCTACGGYRDEKRIKNDKSNFLCRVCTDLKKRKPRPDCSELLKEKINKSKIAREYGVSDTAVRKWIEACKKIIE